MYRTQINMVKEYGFWSGNSSLGPTWYSSLEPCSFCDALPDRTGIGQTAPGFTFPQPNLPPLQGYHRWGGATQAKAWGCLPGPSGRISSQTGTPVRPIAPRDGTRRIAVGVRRSQRSGGC